MIFRVGLAVTLVTGLRPSHNQSCPDDAGPPFLDDYEQTGADPNTSGLESLWKYHKENTKAYAQLASDGTCKGPLRETCASHPGDFTTAYIEGPVNCGNKGWYCRIIPYHGEEAKAWPNGLLHSDVNAAHCNTQEGIDDHGFDRELHCHGSDVDNTYYWWVRDHWNRQYNGKLRCCCGWKESHNGSVPLIGGRDGTSTLINRCDYRMEIPEGESCNRDANEEHNNGFNDKGCDTS